jgi:hypothetical protein
VGRGFSLANLVNDVLIAVLIDNDPHEFHLNRHGSTPL